MTPEPTPSQELEKLYQSDHSIGSHSDDRGGSADFPCYCQVKKRIEAYIKQHELSRKQEWVEKYDELIMAVGNKYAGETRHETALRYIKSCENNYETRAKTIKEQSKE